MKQRDQYKPMKIRQFWPRKAVMSMRENKKPYHPKPPEHAKRQRFSGVRALFEKRM